MFLKLQFVKKKFFLKDSFKISRENKKFIKTINNKAYRKRQEPVLQNVFHTKDMVKPKKKYFHI